MILKKLRSAPFIFLVLLLAQPGIGHGATRASEEVVEYRGMRIDFHLASQKQWTTVKRSLEHQIDIAMSIEAPASVLDFFRTITIVVDPEMLPLQTNGEYRQYDSPPYVRMKPIELPVERAILLHELLHAYHHQVLKQPTLDVEGAYRRARLGGIYPQKYLSEAFLYNSNEYFANMASVFLLGKIERPPYTCSAVKQVQPMFIAYLTSVFGKHECGDQH